MANNNRQDPKDVQVRNIDMTRNMVKQILADLHICKYDTEKLEILRELEKVMEKCAVAEQCIVDSHKTASEAIREVTEEMEECKKEALKDTGVIMSPSNIFLEMYDSALQKKMDVPCDDDIAAKDTEVQVIQQEIQAILECLDMDGKKAVTIVNEDDDLVATEEEVNIIDPITKKPMTDPVRNKICKHVYERSSILEMIKQKKRKGFRCPAMGCANRGMINPYDLVDAPDILRAIRQQQSEYL